MKKTIIALLVIIIIIVGIYLISKNSDTVNNVEEQNNALATSTPQDQTQTVKPKAQEVIGQSVEGRDIVAYHFGNGTSTEILFVGGIHGGYEWNTALVAYQLMDYLKANPETIPANEKITVIPVLNPDGLNKVVGTTSDNFSRANVSLSEETVISGRFNANDVDLNRNFDCDWQTTGKWQSKTVSGGDSAFSEPESQAIKNYVEKNNPAAVIVYYSAAGGVFSSSCHNGVSTKTNKLTQLYADASGYPAHESFDFYATTGDMVNWLAKNNIPAISVLLTNHTDTEWSKNQKGVDAILKSFAK